MKKLITIFLLLFIVTACTTQKHKTKEKTKTETQEKEVNSISSEIKAETAEVKVKTDSVFNNTAFSSGKSSVSILQNLSLKNNGKCADGGEIRFLKFTDAQGNMTEVPVNDNTDLDFSSTSELTKENASLKTENSKLTKEKTDLQTKYDAEVKARKDLEKKQSALQINTDAKSERSQLTAFLWCIVLTVVFWEAGKFYIKKQF